MSFVRFSTNSPRVTLRVSRSGLSASWMPPKPKNVPGVTADGLTVRVLVGDLSGSEAREVLESELDRLGAGTVLVPGP